MKAFMRCRILAIAAAALALANVHAATVSPDGSTLTVAQSQAGGSLVTMAGRWTFGSASNAYGNVVLLNGATNGGYATLLEVAAGGQLYAQASDGSWWRWNNGWYASAAPSVSLSPDGSTLTVAQSQAGGSLITSAGRWAFGAASNPYGNAVLLNGATNGGYATLLEVAGGGQLYAQASDGSWWRWNGAGWSGSAAPTARITGITGVTFDWASHRRLAVGSDNWPATWSNDDNQYAMWGDGGGFGGTDTVGRSSLGVARIVGDSGNYQGFNRYGGAGGECPASIGGKSHGAPVSIGGILYAWITPGSGTSGYGSFSLYKSVDHACTWTPVGVTFDRAAYNVSFPSFVQFGKDNGSAIDAYVYSVATAVSDTSSLNVVQRPGRVMLLRVPTTAIQNQGAYEFFAGLDVTGQPTWSTDPSRAKPVYEDPNGVGPFAQMSYIPGLGAFVYTNQHGNGSNNIGTRSLLTMASSLRPWGPWTILYRDLFFPQSTLTVAQSQAGGSLFTMAGRWTFGSASNAYGNAVLLNGVANGGYATLLKAAGGQLYAQARDGSWWRWNNGWYASAAPTVSAEGSTLTVAQSQAGGSLITSAGRWAFGAASNPYGNAVLVNGAASGGYATLLEVAGGGQLYAQASDGSWWRWNGAGWSASVGPDFEQTVFQWNFAPKWIRDGGRSFTLIFSGTGSNDSWNTINGTFITSP